MGKYSSESQLRRRLTINTTDQTYLVSLPIANAADYPKLQQLYRYLKSNEEVLLIYKLTYVHCASEKTSPANCITVKRRVSIIKQNSLCFLCL